MEVNFFNTTFLLVTNIMILIYSIWINGKLFKSYRNISLSLIFSFLFFFFYIVVHSYVIYFGKVSLYYENTRDLFYPFLAGILATLCFLSYNIGITIYALKRQIISLNKLPLKTCLTDKFLQIGLIVFLIGAASKVITWIILGHGNIITYFKTYYRIQLDMAGEGAGLEAYLGFLYVLIEIGAYILYANYNATKEGKNITLSVILSSFFLNFTSRTTIIRLLIGYMVITALYHPIFRKYIKEIILISIIPLIIFAALGLGALRDSTKGTAWEDADKLYLIMGVNHTMRALSDMLEHKNKFERSWGKSIVLSIVEKPIPRKYWKNKQMNSTMIYTDTMYPGTLEAGGGIASGISAEQYLNFGTAGMLLAFVLFGYLTAFLTYNLLIVFLQNHYNLFFVVIYATLAEFNFYLRGEDVVLMFYKYMIYLIPLILIFIKLKVRSK